MNLTGEWNVTQAWDNTKPYSFKMIINEKGVITVEGGFIGLVTQDDGDRVAFTITNPKEHSHAIYIGKLLASVLLTMAGTAIGTGPSGVIHKGVWSAWRVSAEPIVEKQFAIGE